MAEASDVQLFTTQLPAHVGKVEYRGFICVNKVKTRNIIQDIGTGLKGIVGGEVKNLTKMTAEVRKDLVADAVEKAREMGANAIVGVSFETNSVWEGTMDMVLYGTAVRYAD